MCKITFMIDTGDDFFCAHRFINDETTLHILSILGFEAKPPYSGVSVERVVGAASSGTHNAETEGNAPISREAPQARAANDKHEWRLEVKP